MKTILKKSWIPMLLFLLLTTATSCVDTYFDSNFYDNNLLGTWTLTAVNNRPVYGTEANGFNFMPYGRGTYYYYSNGRPQQMNINWYCQVGGNATYVFINYQATGNNASCMYWFRGNNLYMRFYDNYGQTTVYQYTYDR